MKRINIAIKQYMENDQILKLTSNLNVTAVIFCMLVSILADSNVEPQKLKKQIRRFLTHSASTKMTKAYWYVFDLQ